VGTCLHCNCPPPPRSERTGSTFSCSPCPASDPNAASGGGGEGTRVQVSCDDCRSFICDGECVLMLMMINIFLYEIYYILNSTCKLYQLTNLPFYRMPLVSRIPSQSWNPRVRSVRCLLLSRLRWNGSMRGLQWGGLQYVLDVNEL
jgi:hypothetical protein